MDQVTDFLAHGIIIAAVFGAFGVLELRTDWTIEWMERDGAPWRNYVGYGLLALVPVGLLSVMTIRLSPFAGLAFVFYAWCIVTWMWADEKRSSAAQIAQWSTVGLAAFVTGSALGFGSSVLLLAFCSAGYIVVGLITCIYQRKVLNFDGRFGGASNPNIIAQYCVLMMFCLSYLGGAVGVSLWIAIPCLSLVIIVLGLTRSRTTIQIYLLTGGVYYLLNPVPVSLFSWVFTLGVYAFISCCVIYDRTATVPQFSWRTVSSDDDGSGIVIRFIKRMFSMGRPIGEVRELSGRRPLWSTLIPYVRARPVLGHGYGSFWTVSRSREIAFWHPRSAHSLYLDVALNTGAIGAVLYASVMVAGVHQMVAADSPASRLLIVYLATHALWGLMESTLIRPLYVTFSVWLLLFAA